MDASDVRSNGAPYVNGTYRKIKSTHGISALEIGSPSTSHSGAMRGQQAPAVSTRARSIDVVLYVCMWIGIRRKKEINGNVREDIA